MLSAEQPFCSIMCVLELDCLPVLAVKLCILSCSVCRPGSNSQDSLWMIESVSDWSGSPPHLLLEVGWGLVSDQYDFWSSQLVSLLHGTSHDHRGSFHLSFVQFFLKHCWVRSEFVFESCLHTSSIQSPTNSFAPSISQSVQNFSS